MKIGGTGFILSPANFQNQPAIPTTRQFSSIVVTSRYGSYMKIGGTGFNLSPAHFQNQPAIPTTRRFASFVVTSRYGSYNEKLAARQPRRSKYLQDRPAALRHVPPTTMGVVLTVATGYFGQKRRRFTSAGAPFPIPKSSIDKRCHANTRPPQKPFPATC
jgi:hypothetical protein